VVTVHGSSKADIGVRDGKIAEVAPRLSGAAAKSIDAAGKLVLPGFIDAHTHMGIPIMNTHSVDDFESGSIAAACGGVTTIVDFTVQQPGQTLRESLDIRIGKAMGKSHVDFGLHVNVTDQPLARLAEIPQLIAEGFTAYKVFSTYRQAGMMVTWEEFRQVLKTVHANGGLLCLHAEDNDLVESQTKASLDSGATAPIFHPRSRTAEAEGQAVARAAAIAGELGVRLYIVHLSSRAGLEAGLEARRRGVEIILETCPQYLILTEEMYIRENGHRWITTPPLRTADDREALWQALASGDIDVVATDHCPFTLAQKEVGRHAFNLTPNGIPGVETLFPLLYSHGVAGGRISLGRLLEVLARNPARLFGMAGRKGEIQLGADADLVVWNADGRRKLQARTLHGNADWSPYEGMEIEGALDSTILRGQVLVENGRFVGTKAQGKLLRG